jgi:hypothetical protein
MIATVVDAESGAIICPHCGSPKIRLIKRLGGLVRKALCYPCGKTFLYQLPEYLETLPTDGIQ